MKHIRKRDGSIEEFKPYRIYRAIEKACKAIHYVIDIQAIVDKVVSILELNSKHIPNYIPTVELVQDLVEKTLVEAGEYVVAKEYILYRKQHEELRNEEAVINHALEMVDKYIGNDDWRIKENSNMAYSLQGLNNHISSIITSKYWLNKIYNFKIREAHESGDFHIHDLGLLAAYCCGWDLKDLLVKGFTGVYGKISSAPAKHFRTALGQAVNFIYTLQGEAAGAQAFSNFDTLLAPFVRYDGLSYEEVKQGIQEFVFNINVPTRVGFQCVSEDTEILTPSGWKRYDEVEKGDVITTFNIKTLSFENIETDDVFKRHYKGIMYKLATDFGEQYLSPDHRVLVYDWGKHIKTEGVSSTSVLELKSEYFLFVKVGQLYDMLVKSELPDNPGWLLWVGDDGAAVEYWQFKPIKSITMIDGYSGVIWCPTTKNETIIARRDGHIFVSGNSPFTNITMDLTVPKNMKDEGVIVGGEMKNATYGEFQKEMDMINRAFCEIMLEGDVSGRIFTFPIPTYNLTKDFDWDNKELEPLWKMTAKFGVPYFSNFINSDMTPDMARSMCPLAKEEVILHRESNGELYLSEIGFLYDNYPDTIFEIYADGKFVHGRIAAYDNQELIKVKLANGHTITMSKTHANFVKKAKGVSEETLPGSELRKGYYLPYSTTVYEEKKQGNNKSFTLGYLIGMYTRCGRHTDNYFEFLVERLDSLVYSLFHYSDVDDIQLKKTKNGILVSVSSSEFLQDIKTYIGDGAILSANVDFRMGYLKAFIEQETYVENERLVRFVNMVAFTLGRFVCLKPAEMGGYWVSEAVEGSWFKEDDKVWVMIEEVVDTGRVEPAYCFEVIDDKPLFTIASSGVLTHNCRLRLDNRELHKRGGGLFGSNPMTGSTGVITINLPRLGYLSKTKQEFKDRLHQLMDLAKDAHIIKRKVLERFTERGLYPYSKFYLKDIKRHMGSYWANHFNTIGLIGMNEACLNLLGVSIYDPKGREFAIEIMNYMRDIITEYQEETGLLFNLEATPGEGTSYRLAKLDKERYPDIITAGTVEPYYTNSTQLPVDATTDVFEALEHQDPLQSLYTGGTVLHVFLGEQIDDSETCKRLVRKIAENFTLPYFSITPTFTICPVHGYIPGEHHECPYMKEIDLEESVD